MRFHFAFFRPESHSLHDNNNPSSGCGSSSSIAMYSSKLLSGSSKKTEAAGIQLKTTGSSIGSCLPPIAATPTARSLCGAARRSSAHGEVISVTNRRLNLLAARRCLVNEICRCTRARETVRAQFQRHGRSIVTFEKCPTWHINRVQQINAVKIVLATREAKGRPALLHASF